MVLKQVSCALRSFRSVRAPLITALIASYALSSVPQVQEIYRAMAEEFLGYFLQLVLSLLLLCVVSVGLSLIARELLRELPRPATGVALRRFLPLACAVLPPLGLALGMFFAAWAARIGSPPPETLSKLPELAALISVLDTARIVLYLEAGICTLIIASLLVPRIGFRSYRFQKLLARCGIRIRHIAMFGLVSLLFFSLFSVSGAKLVGPLGIFLLAILGISSFASLLTRAGDRKGLPVLAILILWAFALSFFDLTDNHEVLLSPSDHPRLKRAVDEFQNWYDARKDRKWYQDRNQPYPVFIVAASGGGLYAAQHIATVLSRIQDRCPTFAQHVFAISGVSGGSLGGSLFSSMARKMASNQEHVDCTLGPMAAGGGNFEKAADRFLAHDFLSPVLAAALFPDAVQRFLPAFSARFDRAKAFESSLSTAWSDVFPEAKEDVWTQPFLEQWDPTKAAPALILNATNVEHGYRVALTPFEIIDWSEIGNIVALSNLAEFHALAEIRSPKGSSANKVRDISLAAATSLSARFPWVMPAGRLQFENGPARLVDGGYVENSGSETAFDLLYSLSRFFNRDNRQRESRPPVQFLVIAVTNLQILQKSGSTGLSEALSPIRTMLSTREARAVVSLGNLSRFTEMCGIYGDCGKRVDMVSFMLNLFDYNLPLGWLLAPSTRNIVRLHSGSIDRAGTYLGGNNIDDEDKFARLGAYVSRNDSAACKIAALLEAAQNRSCG
jgi:hypothetical protein